MEERCKAGDEAFDPYLQKYAFFFPRDFLIKRMFNVLNSETKPEHAGFRKASGMLYELYKEDANRLPPRSAAEETLMENLYDDMMTELNLGRASAFLWWLGIAEPM